MQKLDFGLKKLKNQKQAITKLKLKLETKEEYFERVIDHKLFFDYDKIEEGIMVRNRKDGDKMIPIGMKGSKKLKDIFN